MLKKLILLLFFSNLFSVLFAQYNTAQSLGTEKQVLQIKTIDSANRKIFSLHDSLESISMVYKENLPYILFLNFKGSDANPEKRQHYDLNFEGDTHWLAHRYGSIKFNKLSNKTIQSMYPKIDTLSVFVNTASITKDTTLYTIGQNSINQKFQADWVIGNPARYIRSLENLSDNLAKEFAKSKHGIISDSTVVFRATVDKKGNLHNMKLMTGKTSDFSLLIEKAFSDRKNERAKLRSNDIDWLPAAIDHGPVESKIKIYARLNSDTTITLQTPRRLRTFSGE